jgi:hypothetical protein
MDGLLVSRHASASRRAQRLTGPYSFPWPSLPHVRRRGKMMRAVQFSRIGPRTGLSSTQGAQKRRRPAGRHVRRRIAVPGCEGTWTRMPTGLKAGLRIMTKPGTGHKALGPRYFSAETPLGPDGDTDDRPPRKQGVRSR